MRQQKAIVMASGPRTPINGLISSRIGVPRNEGDSGIFTASGRLRASRSSECQAAEAGQNQKSNSSPSGRGRRQSRRQRLRHPFFPPTAAPEPLGGFTPGEHQRLRLAGGDITTARGPGLVALRDHRPPVGRAAKSPGTCAPNHTLPAEPFVSEAKWRCYGPRGAANKMERPRRLRPPRPATAHKEHGVLARGRRGPDRIARRAPAFTPGGQSALGSRCTAEGSQ
jgi:hypothetical protein